jgi:hypothetical protein
MDRRCRAITRSTDETTSGCRGPLSRHTKSPESFSASPKSENMLQGRQAFRESENQAIDALPLASGQPWQGGSVCHKPYGAREPKPWTFEKGDQDLIPMDPDVKS